MRRMLIIMVVAVMIGGSMCQKTPKEAKVYPDFDKLWDYNNPQKTEEKFRALLPEAKEKGDSYYGQLMTQIARTEGLQGKFEEAHRTLDTVEVLITDELVVVKIRYLLERGRVFNSSKMPEKARPLFLEAMELAEEHGEDFYAIDAIHMMQIVDSPEKQLEWAEKAIEKAEETEDERAKGWLGPLYNNTGWSYFDLKQFEKALELFDKSLEWREEKEDEMGIRIAKWCIARTYRELGRIDEAFEIQRALEKEISEKGADPDGFVFEELGELSLLKEKKEEAKKYFKKAYDLLSEMHWLVSSEPERIERIKKLSQ
jgi:tetratricopeptide (TPR) repeat protein